MFAKQVGEQNRWARRKKKKERNAERAEGLTGKSSWSVCCPSVVGDGAGFHFHVPWMRVGPWRSGPFVDDGQGGVSVGFLESAGVALRLCTSPWSCTGVRCFFGAGNGGGEVGAALTFWDGLPLLDGCALGRENFLRFCELAFIMNALH